MTAVLPAHDVCKRRLKLLPPAFSVRGGYGNSYIPTSSSASNSVRTRLRFVRHCRLGHGKHRRMLLHDTRMVLHDTLYSLSRNTSRGHRKLVGSGREGIRPDATKLPRWHVRRFLPIGLGYGTRVVRGDSRRVPPSARTRENDVHTRAERPPPGGG